MTKKFIRTTKTLWDNISDKSLYKDSIVFIEDVQLIWSNGVYYGQQNNDNNFILYVTYDELCEMAASDSLIPGMKYKIYDYEAVSSQDVTVVSNEHLFDIIVTALDESTLDENAVGISRGNTDIFELKYSLDPQPLKFEWMMDLDYPFKQGMFELTVNYIEMDDSDSIFRELDSFIFIEESDNSFSILNSSIRISIKELGESIFFYDASGYPHGISYVGIEYVDYYREYCYCFEYSVRDSYLWMYVPVREYVDIINPIEGHKGVVYYMKDKFGNVGYFDYYNIASYDVSYMYDYVVNSDNKISNCYNNIIYNQINDFGTLRIPYITLETNAVISNCIFKSGVWGYFTVDNFTNNKIFGVRSDGNIVSYCLEDIIAP